MLIYTMKVILLKCQIFYVCFTFLKCKNVKVDLMVNVKNGNSKRKIYPENRINTSLKDISIALNNPG